MLEGEIRSKNGTATAQGRHQHTRCSVHANERALQVNPYGGSRSLEILVGWCTRKDALVAHTIAGTGQREQSQHQDIGNNVGSLEKI